MDLPEHPAGSTLGVEHWDDSLPLRLPGYDQKYAEVSLTLYDEESPEKVRKLAAALDKADYVILASNRLYGSIPRLPRRYPIAMAAFVASSWMISAMLDTARWSQSNSGPLRVTRPARSFAS